MTLVIRHLDTPLGVEISGVDLSGPISPRDVEAIEAAWRDRLVVVFHDQALSDPQLVAFSKNFGELDPPGPNPYGKPFLKDHPELNVISNVVENGEPIGNLGDGEAVWHADMTYVEVPPKAAMLHALEVPPPQAGGNTYFADMFAAYAALPADLKTAVEGRVAVHDASTNSAGMLRKGIPEGHRRAAHRRRTSSPGPHRARDRAQGAVSRPPPQRLRHRARGRGQRGAARCALGARHQAGVHLVPPLEGGRSAHVEQSFGAAPTRSVRPEDAPHHASQPDQGTRAHPLRLR